MKERSLFLTIGVLLGVVIAQRMFDPNTFLVSPANAEYVAHGPGIVAFDSRGGGDDAFALDQNGQTWRIPRGWDQPPIECGWVPGGFIPVAVAQVKFWGTDWFITMNNEAWFRHGDEWRNCGVWPGGTVPAANDSWGSMKKKYRDGR